MQKHTNKGDHRCTHETMLPATKELTPQPPTWWQPWFATKECQPGLPPQGQKFPYWSHHCHLPGPASHANRNQELEPETQACWCGHPAVPTWILTTMPNVTLRGSNSMIFAKLFHHGTFHYKWSPSPFSWVITSFVPLWIKICYICNKYWM